MPLTHPISRQTWYLLAVIYASMFALVIGNMLYTDHVATTNARKWCNLLVTLDDAYSQQPPRSDAGQRLAAETHRLRVDLRCKGKRDAPLGSRNTIEQPPDRTEEVRRD